MSTIVRNGIDYSAGWPAGGDIRAAGHDFACRYMGGDSRCLTLPEKQSLDEANVDIVAIGEYDKIVNGEQVSAMEGGGASGGQHAMFADHYRAELLLPDQMPIYFTLDVAPGSVDWSLVGAYLDAAASELGSKDRVAFYGGLAAIEWYLDTWGGKWPWQTYAWSVRNGVYTMDPRTILWQYDIYGESVAGIDVDLNKAFVENFGQASMFNGAPPKPKWAQPVHPDWYAASLSERYPTVGRWGWNGQRLILDCIRHNALALRRTWQYAEPTTSSKHAGAQIQVNDKVSIERLTRVQNVTTAGKTVTRDWCLTGDGTWVPEAALSIDVTVRRRRRAA